MNTVNILEDRRVDCYSVMTELTVNDYLNLVVQAYQNRGRIEGQREALKTSTSIRIRKRMIEDLKAGAVLPPIVLGVVMPLENLDENSWPTIHEKIIPENIYIIDGMQRTTALLETKNHTNGYLTDKKIRVEYWIAKNTNALIYRMLVLNTGQVPWNLRRQIETVFRSIIQEIKEQVPDIDVLEIDESKRRIRSGQFQADQLIELYLAFGARKEKIDTKEHLADEFTKQDFIESIAEQDFTTIFYQVLDYLVKLDKLFDKYHNNNNEEQRFDKGKDLFDSQPARIGFVVAIALKILGRPGNYYNVETQKSNWNEIQEKINNFIHRLDNMDENEIGEFLDFQTLNELISQKSGKVGDFEREFFLKSFQVLVEDKFEVPTMTPCWRAYQ
ncbi:MAG TPA: hypothetical protein DCQ51_22775 [Planktothrix sp. UBA8407]|jgi:hypothetical protein|nr:hypothetical protein [Planktothrix sp. UBA8407]HBK23409.1 hypothetical protein [Planktothrix sp. UBA10369]